jgi:hypothetical protein
LVAFLVDRRAAAPPSSGTSLAEQTTEDVKVPDQEVFDLEDRRETIGIAITRCPKTAMVTKRYLGSEKRCFIFTIE